MTNQSKNKEIAETIFRQIGANRLAVMIGIKQKSIIESGLDIKFKARAKNKAKGLQIILKGDDTYTMRFYSIIKLNVIERGTYEGIYADSLLDVFENETGLATRLN